MKGKALKILEKEHKKFFQIHWDWALTMSASVTVSYTVR
jgi:hypothetical protein